MRSDVCQLSRSLDRQNEARERACAGNVPWPVVSPRLYGSKAKRPPGTRSLHCSDCAGASEQWLSDASTPRLECFSKSMSSPMSASEKEPVWFLYGSQKTPVYAVSASSASPSSRLAAEPFLWRLPCLAVLQLHSLGIPVKRTLEIA